MRRVRRVQGERREGDGSGRPRTGHVPGHNRVLPQAAAVPRGDVLDCFPGTERPGAGGGAPGGRDSVLQPGFRPRGQDAVVAAQNGNHELAERRFGGFAFAVRWTWWDECRDSTGWYVSGTARVAVAAQGGYQREQHVNASVGVRQVRPWAFPKSDTHCGGPITGDCSARLRVTVYS